MYTKVFFTGISLGLVAFFMRTSNSWALYGALLVLAGVLLYGWVYTEGKTRQRFLTTVWTLVLAVAGTFLYAAILNIMPSATSGTGNTVQGLNILVLTALGWTTLPLLAAALASNKLKLVKK